MSAHISSKQGRIGLLAMVSVLMALACNAPSLVTEPTAPPTTQPTTQSADDQAAAGVTLTVVNGLSEDVCTVHFSYTVASTWGINRLAESGPLAPGEGRDFLLPPAHYDLIAIACSGEVTGEARDLDVSSDLTHTVEAAEPTVTEAVIWLYEECQLPTLDTNTAITIRTPWMTTSARLARQNGERLEVVALVDGVEVARSAEPSAVMDGMAFSALGCPGDDDPEIFVYWDLPVGQLEAGSHLIAVEYHTSEEIYDGYDIYPAGSLGGLERTIEVSAGR